MLDGMLKYTLQTYLGQRHPGFLMRINGRVSQFPLCFHVFYPRIGRRLPS